MAKDWHRIAYEAERARDNAVAQLEYEQSNRRKSDAEIAHERDDFIKELETANADLRASLVAIQELHCSVPIYTTEAGECEHGDECAPIELDEGAYCPVHTDGVTCNACAELIQANGIVDEWPTYPCATRRLADDALTARTTKNGETND